MNLRDRLNQIAQDLENKQAQVGWFETATYPTGQKVAYIAMIHEMGAPEQGIPPRPFIRTTIAEKKQEWAKIVGRAIQEGLNGEEVLELVGLKMQGDIRQKIASITKPELKKATLAARRRRGNNDTKPLNDTGHLMATLTSVVAEKE